MPMKVIQAAHLDSLMACGPSVMLDGYTRIRRRDRDGEAARALMSWHLNQQPTTLKAQCEGRGANEERVAEMFAFALQTWADVRDKFPKLLVDRTANTTIGDELHLVSRIAVASPIGETSAIFLEWFADDAGDGYKHRMTGLAFGLWSQLGRPEDDIRGIIAFVRNRYIRVMRWTADELREWERELLAQVRAQAGAEIAYTPGRQCVSCPIFATCPARKGLVDNLTARFLGHGTGARFLAGATEETKDSQEVRATLDDLTLLVKLTQADIDAAKELIRSTVERVGPVKLDSGLSLVMRRIETEALDPVKAFRPLRSHLPDADILAAARLSLPKLLAAKAGSYGRGEKTTARDSLKNDLTKAGAVNVTVTYRLEEVDLTETQDDERCTTVRPGSATEGNHPRADSGGGKREVGGVAGGDEKPAQEP